MQKSIKQPLAKCYPSKDGGFNLDRNNKTIKDKNFQLTQAYEKYSWLAENMDDVVWLMNIDGSLIYVSPSVEKLRGYTPEEVVHQSFNERICSSSRQQLKDAMAA